jgi:hypothetical protein
MTPIVSTGYFDGSNGGVPYSWGIPTSWLIDGTSQTGMPGAGDIVGIGLPSQGQGYIVSVTGNTYSVGAVNFTYPSISAPADYIQDAVLQVLGPSGRLNLTGAPVGTSVQSLAGNPDGDGYVGISLGGVLEVDSLASPRVSIFFGNYANTFDGTAPTINYTGANNNLLVIGAPGGTPYNYTNGSFGSPIYGLYGADRVVLSQIPYSSNDTLTFTPGTPVSATGTQALLNSEFGTPGTLTVHDGSGATIATLTIAAPVDTGKFGTVKAGSDLAIADSSTATGSPTCFVSGTRILTERGEIAVEHLREGDRVVTVEGGARMFRPVRWVGQRQIDLAGHPRPEMMSPVRIRRNAIAADTPHRDLVVSPDHAIFIDGKLIPARMLVNGATIEQESGTQSVRYFHIELDQHAIMLAEGLSTESYLDTGNRAFFANGGQSTILHPEIAIEAGLNTYEQHGCAPLTILEGDVLPVWQRLADRAAALGSAVVMPMTTSDPALQLVVDGRALRPIAVALGWYVFPLPRGVHSLRLTSRSSSPAETRPWLNDRRYLGVFVERLVVQTLAGVQEIPMDHPNLSRGWHSAEARGGTLCRWTDGDAELPLTAAATDGGILEVLVAAAATYPIRSGAEAA